jgi:hypothetical protein
MPDSIDPSTHIRLGGAKAVTRSRGNALRHGLTATTVVPPQYEQRVVEIREQLAADLKPVSANEQYYIDRMAHHAAALEVACRAEPASLRTSMATAGQIAALAGLPTGMVGDLEALIAVTCHATTQVARYRRAHERAYQQWSDYLYNLRSQRTTPAAAPPLPERYRTEAGCLAYLIERLRSASWRCTRCGASRGYWLASRTRRECRRCGAQHGPRTGTVMQHSRISLRSWILGVHHVLSVPTVSPRELADVVGIRRLATVRSIIRRIRSAMSSPARDFLLAGMTVAPSPPDGRSGQRRPTNRSNTTTR